MAESQIAHGPTLAAPPASSADRLAPGAVAGDYVVDRFLGAGAMGDVYAGRHPVIGKRVAIKVLKRELAADPEAAERFIREAKAVNQIDHPNVIDVFNFGRLADGRLYLVMDLVDGRSLRAAVEEGPLAVDAALAVLDKIADALDAAHARGVVHRDLKPDNVMLSSATPPQVFVLDFGIAKLVEAGHTGGTLTGKGSWLGTPGYMAPEQWSSDGAGPASDRYALGVMAYELLAGSLPFQAPTLPQMMEQHFRAKVPALATKRGTIRHHATLDPVLARAMAKKPDDRFPTARGLVDALRSAAGGNAVGRPRRSLAVPAAAGAGVLVVAVVGLVVVRGDSPADDDARAAAVSSPYARVDVITQPNNAVVRRDGRRLGTTPLTTEVRPGTAVVLEISKPGYRAIRETLAATRLVADQDVVVRENLEPIVGFDGVWAMPDGQLRAFQRIGEQIEVSKLQTVTGAREPWRRFDLVEPPEGVTGLVFATTAELTDDRGAPDPSCRIAHRIEYRFDPESTTLAVRAERVETARHDGRCIVRARDPGDWTALARVDRDAGDTRWTQPPVGRPIESTAPRPAPPPNQRRVVPRVNPGPRNANQAGNQDIAPARQQANPPPPQQVNPPPRGDSQIAPQVGN